MRTPLRSFRIDDDLWHAARLKANQDGTNLSQVINTLLAAYASGRLELADSTKGGHRKKR